MKIYGTKKNVFDAVDAVVHYGVAVVEGTRTPAVDYMDRIIECLSVYPNIIPDIGYRNVVNNGYLYYVYDTNRFNNGDPELEALIIKIDESNT